MNHRLVCLVAAGLAVAAGPRAEVSASVYYPTPTVEILVAGHPQRQYHSRDAGMSRPSRAASTPFACETPMAFAWLSRCRWTA